MSKGNIIEYNLSDFDVKNGMGNLNEKRTYCANVPCMTKEFRSEVTIWIQAYNNFEKTKRCIESVLKYTTDVDYDLILVDNNAGKETYEYFKSLDYPKKTVIHFNKNTGSAYPFTVVPVDMISRYFVLLNNDLIVTKNWLANLLTVMKSDAKIGIVNPVSNNVSNCQGVEFEYNSYEEMQTIAEKINVTDRTKWEERLRVVTLGTLVSKECLCAMGWPFFDIGFSHEYMDDDMSFRARRAGYKIMVTRDTWICHDHSFNEETNEIIIENEREMEKFRRKYFGLDVNDYATNTIVLAGNMLDKIKITAKQQINILGIDTRCGQPILDIKNKMGFEKKVNTSAYFQDAKYYVDLSSICNAEVICDREENIKYRLNDNTYDYIIIGEPINMYNDPVRMVNDTYNLLSNGGQLIFALKNTRNMISLITALGYELNYNQGIYQDISVEDFVGILNYKGFKVESVVGQKYGNMSDEIFDFVNDLINQYADKSNDIEEIRSRIQTDAYWMILRKN